MVFLSLRDAIAQDLQLLTRLSPQLVTDFCALALQFLAQGARKGAFKKAAAALAVDEEAVAGAAMAMLEVLLEAARYNLSMAEFVGSLGDVAMPEESRRAIAQVFADNKTQLRERVAAAGPGGGAVSAGLGVGGSPTVPAYRALDWRFEVAVASRHLHDQMRPSFTLRLDTAAPAVAGATGGSANSLDFTADFAALRRASDAIDEAVAEAKSAHSRRVNRYIR